MTTTYIAIAAITIDGKIAKDAKHFSDWTSKEDKIFMRSLLDKCDVVIVGNNTYKTAIKPLSKRNCIVFSRSVNQLVSESANLVFINTDKTDLKKYIVEKNYQRVAILGGAQVYTYCLEQGMIDELYLTVEPVVFGRGIDLFTASKDLNQTFQLISSKKLNSQGTLLIKYKVLTTK